VLVSGKFARFAAAIALLAPVLLAVNLLSIRSTAQALLISNSLDFVVLFLAALCCFFVARRCTGFARQLWLLLAVAFSLESIAQALTSYYQSFERPALAGAVPSDVFFFVWAAPIFMIFLPRSGEDTLEFDYLRVLDFAQVGIVALTMYIYFFYAPSRWRAGQYAVLREILVIYMARDSLLALGFYARSRASIPLWFRSFCRVMAVVMAASACSDAIYFLTYNPELAAPTWGDMFFMLPYVTVVFFALSWKAPAPDSIALPASRVGSFFAQQFLPVGLPLLVIFMAQVIARDRFLLGWGAVVVSVLCSSARLILTNRKTRRVAEHLLSTEKALRASEHLLSTAFRSSPDAFSINIFPNGPYVEVNDGFRRLTGYTREETLGKTPGELNLWVEPGERAKVLEQLRHSNEARDIELHFRTKTGQIRFGQMYASLIELDSRPCSLVVVRDITARKEAEAILRDSEERFRTLVENLSVGIIIYDPEVRVVFANQAVQDAFGGGYKDFLGKTIDELGLVTFREDGSEIPPEARPVPVVLATKKPVRSQVIGVRSRDSDMVIWTLLDAIPQFNAAGEISRVIVSVTDLTEQRRALEALRESEERFRTLVSELHVAVALHQPDGRVEYVNPALVRMFGFPDVSVVTGKLPSEIGFRTLTEDGRALADEERPVSVVIRTKTAVRDVLVGFRRPDSDKVIWVFGSSVPHLDNSGNLVRVITSFMDMTEHRHALEALRESEERFRTLVRDLHVAVILHRPDGSIEFANAAAYRMFDVPEGEATGKRPSDYGIVVCDENGSELPPDRHPVAEVLRTRTAAPNNLVALRRSGSDKLMWVFGNAVPQFDTSGNVIRVITSFADISDMKNAERAIHQLSTQLLRLQDEERRRLGRELHDGLAQTVLAINLSLAQVRQSLQYEEHSAVRALEKARSLTQQMSREIRTLSYLLHPPLLDELGLVSALREYAYGFSERSSIDTQLDVLSDFDRFPQEVELALFRVVQESLANIQRHSGSATAKINLRQEGSLVTLEIIDFGRGMVVPGNGSPGSGNARLGVGIAGMRERISQLGGRLEIVSGRGGTTVRAKISVSGRKAAEDIADLTGRNA